MKPFSTQKCDLLSRKKKVSRKSQNMLVFNSREYLKTNYKHIQYYLILKRIQDLIRWHFSEHPDFLWTIFGTCLDVFKHTNMLGKQLDSWSKLETCWTWWEHLGKCWESVGNIRGMWGMCCGTIGKCWEHLRTNDNKKKIIEILTTIQEQSRK